LRGKFNFFEFLSKKHGGLPEKKCEKNAKKRFVIKIKYFYFIFIVFFYNECEIIEKTQKMTFVVSLKNGPKKRVIMRLVVEKMRFSKIFSSITFFYMGD
jgi:hypothetical protein